MNEFLIFIPVYNEENSIRAIVQEIRYATEDVDVLIIDDGSTDNTPRIIQQIEDINLIRHTRNEGYGKTLIDGFNYAVEKDYQYVITIDSDKQHQPGEINKFISTVKQYDSDIISGSRYMEVSPEEIEKAPEDRIRINKRITDIINRMTGFQLTDSFCGFKCYRVDALRKLRLTETGYGLPLQLWIQAWKKGLTVTEIPVQLIYFDHTSQQTSSWKNMFRRYRYYLQIIQKEAEDYEYNDTGSTSR
jgi:dolichol-phosphate mannosyltransferase